MKNWIKPLGNRYYLWHKWKLAYIQNIFCVYSTIAISSALSNHEITGELRALSGVIKFNFIFKSI